MTRILLLVTHFLISWLGTTQRFIHSVHCCMLFINFKTMEPDFGQKESDFSPNPIWSDPIAVVGQSTTAEAVSALSDGCIIYMCQYLPCHFIYLVRLVKQIYLSDIVN